MSNNRWCLRVCFYSPDMLLLPREERTSGSQARCQAKGLLCALDMGDFFFNE